MSFNMFMPNEDDKRLIMTALDTIEISRQGYYCVNGKRVKLESKTHMNFSNAIVYSPDLLETIDLNNYTFRTGKYKIYVVNCDSFEAASNLNMPLVMNFGNPYHPGGAFLYGAKAQEESLCRSSTLYLSLSSEIANEMYSYNHLHKSAVNSDYMILSPNVCVFRNTKYELLDTPYYISVISVPAPDNFENLLSEDMLDKIMKGRIRNMFNVAVKHSYNSLVLGAWGCGAFDNDTYTVANCFYDVLVNEEYVQWFDNVIFAVLGDKKKLEIFQKQFEK